ncbi:protein-disulfide reductase DsbD [Spiribacter insolitus]|uniref:Thiol:disulfide interchange protein DsbD n=1 Tax=Spiribacter insolitus TaxID=3122417 RepID=A0ABV3TAQ1_9GAMM
MTNKAIGQLAFLVGLWLTLAASAVTAQSSLGGLFGNESQSQDVLPVEEAFELDIRLHDDGQATIDIDVQDGYYVYRDSLDVELDGAGAQQEDLAFDHPQGTVKEDAFFGRQTVYTRPVSLPLIGQADFTSESVFSVAFQGCSESGVCYPPYRATGTPSDQRLAYAINPTAPTLTAESSTAGGQTAESAATAAPSGASADTPQGAGGGEAGRLERLLNNASLPTILAGFFVAGLLLAFTACLYPMIPILSGLIAGDPHRSGSLRALGLSLIYVESTAITYALAGVAAGLTGAAVQADLQSPWVLGSFAAVFVILALGMFGVFELRLPNGLQTRLTTLSNRQRGGTAIGVAIMGVLSTLIVGACSGPALIAALVFIGSTGDAWLGGLALFTLANGMGLPLLLIGTAAGRWLPRSGPWMNTVRAIFGVGFLAVALWTLERFLPGPVTLALWGVLLIGCGVWLGVFERVEPPVSNIRRLARTIGVAAMLWGAASLLGASAGGGDVLRPLTGLSLSAGGGGGSEQQEMAFRDINSPEELETALMDARAAGRPVMVDIYADWCVYCVQLEQRTFTDSAVQDAVAEAMLLRADVTDMNAEHRALMSRLDVYLPPAIVFYGPQGRENRDARVVGFLGPEAFIARARQGLAGPAQ